MEPRYRRVVLKLSGEMLGINGEGKAEGDSLPQAPPLSHACLDRERVQILSRELIALSREGVQMGVVLGGGNFWRGDDARWIHAATSHQMGMLATLMNALALKATVESQGGEAEIISALNVLGIVDGWSVHQAITAMRRGKIVFLGGGTGQPYFTTDTAAALWALKLEAEVLLKATKVDGVYSADPIKCPEAIRYERLTHEQAFREGLRVMDRTAFSLCMEQHLPIIVFKLLPVTNIRRVIFGETLGTIVEE